MRKRPCLYMSGVPRKPSMWLAQCAASDILQPDSGRLLYTVCEVSQEFLAMSGRCESPLDSCGAWHDIAHAKACSPPVYCWVLIWQGMHGLELLGDLTGHVGHAGSRAGSTRVWQAAR